MSLAVGVATSSKGMGFDDNKGDGEEETKVNPNPNPDPETDDEDDDDAEANIQLGPQCTLKELSEKDKDDESLRRWKEQLLGSVDINSVGGDRLGVFGHLSKLSFITNVETLDPEVRILSLTIKTAGRDDIVLPIPEDGNPRSPWFVLKEGSRYNLVFTFQVSNNIVSGFKYKNNVWKTGIKVDNTKEMIGTFSPQAQPYTHVMPEETTPSGIFARGSYSAKTQFLDDDKRCYLELNYYFEIKKDWQST